MSEAVLLHLLRSVNIQRENNICESFMKIILYAAGLRNEVLY